MDLTLYQVDAFTDEVFKGNPAAIVPLTAWLGDDQLQAIALENNLSETAYFIPHEDGAPGHYHLRWFTPGAEVDLCGHATLGTAYVLYEFLGETADTLRFETRSGTLVVTRKGGGMLAMDFPALQSKPVADKAEVDPFAKAIGQRVEEMRTSLEYAMCVLAEEAQVRAITYSGAIEDALRASPYWGLIVTAPAASGTGRDVVSRFFAPQKGVPEDPVTGSAHCRIVPYWAERLGKNELTAYQASPRGGTVHCTLRGDRVSLAGHVAAYMKAVITV